MPARYRSALLVAALAIAIFGCAPAVVTDPPGGAQDDADHYPSFPWPPPRFSASHNLPTSTFRDAETLGDVDDVLTGALEAEGYTDRGYYVVPQGFALATRIERIHEDGSPYHRDERWEVEMRPPAIWSLAYLRRLFTKDLPPGHFRVFVFIVSQEPFSSEGEVTRDEASEWPTAGANRLPPTLASVSYTATHAVTALIYEFEFPPGAEEVVVRTPGALQGRDHLEQARLWSRWVAEQ